MKILYVFFHNYNDMPYHTREWVEAAIELGHEVTVITSITPSFLEEIGWKDKITVRQVEFPGTGKKNYLKLLFSFKKEVRIAIKSIKPDIVYERFSLISTAAASVCKKQKVPYATEVNGIFDIELNSSKMPFLRRHFFRFIQKYVYKNCAKIFTVTDQIQTWLIDNYSISQDKIKTISNGVNEKRFSPVEKEKARTQSELPQKKYIIGYLGSLFKWYDLPIFIRTAQEIIENIPEVCFVIGGGQEPFKSELIEQVAQAELKEYFIFSGQIPWDKAGAFTSSFDIAIAPTKFKVKYEVSPLKLASYMACARPVIGSETPGLAKVIKQTKCGLVYQDDKSFINSILKMYSKKDSEAITMGARGREYVCQNNTWKIQVKKTLDFLNL